MFQSSSPNSDAVPKSSLPDNFDEIVESAIIIHDDEEVFTFDFFDKNVICRGDRREDIENISAATASAVVSGLCCHPFDMIKRRLQSSPMLAHRSVSRSIMHVGKLIYVEHGIFGLWRSHGRAQFFGLLQTITLFYAYENLRVQLDFTRGMAPHPQLCCFAAGLLSGATAVLLVHPLSIIKTRHEAYNRMVHQFGLHKFNQRSLPIGGLHGFYSGFGPTLLHFSLLYGFKFLIYNAICERILISTDFDERYELQGLNLAAAGAVTGVLANLFIYPLDSIKQRMMATNLDRQRFKFDSTCRNIVQCARAIWQREGLLAFYNGLVACMLRSAINTALQFSIFDSTIHTLRDWE